MSNVFLTATEARSGARNNLTIFNEIRDLEAKILIEVDLGNLEVTVDDTVMTSTDPNDIAVSQSYFDVWQNLATDRVLDDQMNEVIKHFEALGYSIVRKFNTETNTTFFWELKW